MKTCKVLFKMSNGDKIQADCYISFSELTSALRENADAKWLFHGEGGEETKAINLSHVISFTCIDE